MAAQLAVLPTTKPQPARNPHQGPAARGRRRTCRPTSGTARRAGPTRWRCSTPPTAARASPISSPAPAAAAAGAKAAKTPAPIIEPRPMTTASPVPRRRASSGPRLTPADASRPGPGRGRALCQGVRRARRPDRARRRRSRARCGLPGEPAGGALPLAGRPDAGSPSGRPSSSSGRRCSSRSPALRFGSPGSCRRSFPGAAGVLLTVIDVQHKLLPDRVTLPAIGGGAVLLAVAALGTGEWRRCCAGSGRRGAVRRLLRARPHLPPQHRDG